MTLQDLGKGTLTEKVMDTAVFSEGGSSSSRDASGGVVYEYFRSRHSARPLLELNTDSEGALVRLVGETKIKEFFP